MESDRVFFEKVIERSVLVDDARHQYAVDDKRNVVANE